LLALLFRAWSKYRLEFTFRPGATDRTSQHLFGLIGLATEGLRERVGLPAARLLRYAGFVWQRPRSAVFLGRVISDYFDEVPAEVEPCVLRRVELPVEDQNRLGIANARLGDDLVIGTAVPDRTGKCRIRLGPMDRARFEEFLPCGGSYRTLGALVPLLLPDPLVYDLRLVLKGSEVPMLRLSAEPDAARLGWTSWVRNDPNGPDASELFPAPPAAAA